MGKIVYTKEREKEIHENNKIDLNLFKKRSSAKTPKGIVLGYMKKFSKNEDDATFNKRELVFLFQELYRKISDVEKISRVELNCWKGESGIEIIQIPNGWEIIRFQKKDQDSTPKELRTEVNYAQVKEVIKAIRNSSKDKAKIKTRDIARNYCLIDGIEISTHGAELFPNNEFDFDVFFSDRATYITFNLILRLLDKFQFIHYRAGYTTILKEKFELQSVINK